MQIELTQTILRNVISKHNEMYTKWKYSDYSMYELYGKFVFMNKAKNPIKWYADGNVYFSKSDMIIMDSYPTKVCKIEIELDEDGYKTVTTEVVYAMGSIPPTLTHMTKQPLSDDILFKYSGKVEVPSDTLLNLNFTMENGNVYVFADDVRLACITKSEFVERDGKQYILSCNPSQVENVLKQTSGNAKKAVEYKNVNDARDKANVEVNRLYMQVRRTNDINYLVELAKTLSNL